jgi:membrane-associated phospholipid phosphatase
MKLVANIISILFHPIFIPTVGVYLLFSTPTEPVSFIKNDSFYFFQDDFKVRLYSLLAVLTIAAPLLSMMVLKTGKIISSYRLENPEERKAPLIMIIVYLGIVILQLFVMDPGNIVPKIVKTYILSVALSIIVILSLLKVMKISIHTTAIASLTALMYVYLKTQMDYNALIIPSLFIVLGVVATSRLILNEHKVSEIYLGALLGFSTTFMLTSYF